MSVIAALNVNLTAKTDGFEAAFKGSGMSLKQWKREAVSAFDATRTPQEAYNKRILELGKLYRANLIEKETFIRAARQEKEALDAANPAIAEHARLMARGQEVYRSTMTAAEQYAATARELGQLHAAGAIDIETRNRAMERATQTFNEASGATDQARAAEDAHNQAMREGQAVTDAMRSPLEHHQAELKRLNSLLDQGAIDLETWRRAVAHADGQLAKATPTVQTFGSKMSGAFAALKSSVVGNLAAAFGIREMVSFVHSGVEAGAMLHSLAARTGSTVEQLAALQVAASQNGSSFDAVQGAVDRLNKSLGNAEDSEKIASSLDAIGLSAEHLRSVGAAQAFVEISEGMKAIENPAERAKIATDLFGQSGTELLNVLALGRDGFAAASVEAEAFGVSLSAADAKDLNAVSDALGGIGTFFKGLATQAAIAFGPIIEWVAHRIPYEFKRSQAEWTGWTAAIVGGIADIIRVVGYLPDWLGGGLATDAAQYLDTYSDELKRRKQELLEQADVLYNGGKGKDTQTFAAAAAAPAAPAAAAAADMQATAAAGVESLKKDLKGFFDFATSVAKAAKEETAKQGVAKLQKDAKGFVDFMKGVKANADAVIRDKAQAAMDAAQTPLDKYNRTLSDLEALKGLGAIDQKVFDINKMAALDELDKATAAGTEYKPISALERGSAAAFSAIQSNKPPKTEQEILDQAKHAAKQREEMIAAFKGGQPQVAGVRR